MSDITKILEHVDGSEHGAAEELLPFVYEELRKLAAAKMAQEAPGHTLQPTALVHEAWLRLAGEQKQHWNSRAQFFAAAAEAMRRILIDKARSKRAVRHGGGLQRIDIACVDLLSRNDDEQILAVNEALDKLTAQDPIEAELVKLRYFVGLTVDEAAGVLDISPRTARNYWAHARTWLYHAIMVSNR